MRKGSSHTMESRIKMRASHLGMRCSPATEFKKGMKPWSFGMTKEMNPILKRMADNRIDDGNPNFKGGRDRSYARRVASRVLNERVCSMCGSLLHIDVHHKDGDERNNVADNLEYMCRTCHMDTRHDVMTVFKFS
jgi:hypothetical protein